MDVIYAKGLSKGGSGGVWLCVSHGEVVQWQRYENVLSGFTKHLVARAAAQAQCAIAYGCHSSM